MKNIIPAEFWWLAEEIETQNGDDSNFSISRYSHLSQNDELMKDIGHGNN